MPSSLPSFSLYLPFHFCLPPHSHSQLAFASQTSTLLRLRRPPPFKPQHHPLHPCYFPSFHSPTNTQPTLPCARALSHDRPSFCFPPPTRPVSRRPPPASVALAFLVPAASRARAFGSLAPPRALPLRSYILLPPVRLPRSSCRPRFASVSRRRGGACRPRIAPTETLFSARWSAARASKPGDLSKASHPLPDHHQLLLLNEPDPLPHLLVPPLQLPVAVRPPASQLQPSQGRPAASPPARTRPNACSRSLLLPPPAPTRLAGCLASPSLRLSLLQE